jgi:hypothetical protein
MPRFNLDDQRAVVCLFGLLGLVGEALAFYITGRVLPDMLTGIFATMDIGPVATSTWTNYRRYQDDPPDPPRRGRPSTDLRGDGEEEEFYERHGYYEVRAA